MLSLISRLLFPTPEPLPGSDASLALAALLVRVAKTDGLYAAEEVERIERALATRYGLDPFAVARLRAEAGEFLTGLEFFSDLGLDLALRHVAGLSWPLDSRGGAYLLVEAASGSPLVPLDDILSAALAEGMEAGLVTDGALAASEAQRAAFWRLREEQPEGQRLDGAQAKHDISVPPGRIAEFVAEAALLCEAAIPGVRVNPFGHLGDGNIHFNLSPPDRKSVV